MALDPQLKRQHNQLVSYALPTGTVNEAGEATFSTATANLMRCEPWEQVVEKWPGTFVVSSHRLYADGSFNLTRYTRFWLPGSPVSPVLAREPVLFRALPDEYGNTSHYEFWL
jgi:hypothetical protein